MKCRTIQYGIPDYVFGKLSDAERAVIAGHLSTCQRCRSEADRLAGLAAELNTSPSSLPPERYFDTLLPSIHKRIEVKPLRKFPNWGIRYALPVAAATVFAFVILRIAPSGMEENSADLGTVLRQLQPEELQDAVEHQVSSSVLETSVITDEQPTASSTADKEVLQSILQDVDRPYSLVEAADVDLQTSIESLSSTDANEVAALLEQKSSGK